MGCVQEPWSRSRCDSRQPHHKPRPPAHSIQSVRQWTNLHNHTIEQHVIGYIIACSCLSAECGTQWTDCENHCVRQPPACSKEPSFWSQHIALHICNTCQACTHAPPTHTHTLRTRTHSSYRTHMCARAHTHTVKDPYTGLYTNISGI